MEFQSISPAPCGGQRADTCYTPAASTGAGSPKWTAEIKHTAQLARSARCSRSRGLADRGGGRATGERRAMTEETMSAIAAAQPSAENLLGSEDAARRLPALADRRRRPLRPPDQALEPEDAPVHLRRAQRHPHHRPRPDGAPLQARATTSSSRRSVAAATSCSSAPSARRRTSSSKRRSARGHVLRHQPLARRHAHQLPHHQAGPRSPALARAHEGRRHLRAAPEEGSRRASRRSASASRSTSAA